LWKEAEHKPPRFQKIILETVEDVAIKAFAKVSGEDLQTVSLLQNFEKVSKRVLHRV